MACRNKHRCPYNDELLGGAAVCLSVQVINY